MAFETRIVEPIDGWDSHRREKWGADGLLIEDWFCDGEGLEYDALLLTKMEDEWEPSVVGWQIDREPEMAPFMALLNSVCCKRRLG
ncbi:MAG: hypothetical protein V1754_14970 [Pseudomonadota bacterium]